VIGPELFEDLLSKGVYAVGTLRPNRRGVPQDLVASADSLQRGQFEHRQKDRLVATVWMDRAPVYFLSTCVSPLEGATVKRRDDEGKEVTVNCPTVVVNYNNYVHGVDTVNQLSSYYGIGRRSLKWWRSVAWWLFDIAIVNAYTLGRLTHAKKWPGILDFRIDLMKELANHAEKGGSSGDLSKNEMEEEAVGHYPFMFDSTRDCGYCSIGEERKIHRKSSKYGCKQCKVHLCVFPCFEKFHAAKTTE
jgi:hypothetical protein